MLLIEQVPAVEGIIAVVPFHEAVLVGDVVGVEVKMALVSGRPVPFRRTRTSPRTRRGRWPPS